MNKESPKTDVSEEIEEIDLSIELIKGDDVISLSTRTMAAQIDQTFKLVCGDAESARVIAEELNAYFRVIPLPTYFVLSRLKDSVMAPIVTKPDLRLFIQTLDHVFISLVLSKTSLSYKDYVEKVFETIQPTLSTDIESSPLPDNLFLESKCDVEKARGLISRSSLFLTIYFFKLAFAHSGAYINIFGNQGEKYV